MGRFLVSVLALFVLFAEPAVENCGISGVVLFPRDRKEPELEFIRTLVREMLVVTCKRGTDATGVAFISKQGAASLFKRPASGPEFVKLPEFEEHLKKLGPDTTIVLGHNRAASVGSPRNNDNNHPVFAGSVYLVHNGHIGNHRALGEKHGFERRGEVDTEIIAHLMLKEAGEGVTPESIRRGCSELKGSFAIAFADTREPRRAWFARNRLPVTYATVPELDLFIFNSELELIRRAWKAATDRHIDYAAAAFGEEVELAKDSGIVVRVDEGKIETFELETK